MRRHAQRPATGEAVAGLLTTCVLAARSPIGVARRQRIVRSCRPRNQLSFFEPVSNAVRKTRSPHTTGEECPCGTGSFQSMCFDGPNSNGGAASGAATPVALGPRNCGHAASWATARLLRATATATTRALSLTDCTLLRKKQVSRKSRRSQRKAFCVLRPCSDWGATQALSCLKRQGADQIRCSIMHFFFLQIAVIVGFSRLVAAAFRRFRPTSSGGRNGRGPRARPHTLRFTFSRRLPRHFSRQPHSDSSTP